MINKLKGLFILICLFTSPAWCAQDTYHWRSTDESTRFKILTSELRCLVCQNQTIAESNAPLANDLREQVFKKIQQGESNKQIIDYLVVRYGDYILYRPPFRSSTLLLWFGPFLLLGFGLFFLIYLVSKNKRD